MKGPLKELFRISGWDIGFTHLAPHRRKEWCLQALSPHVVLDYVTAVYKAIPT